MCDSQRDISDKLSPKKRSGGFLYRYCVYCQEGHPYPPPHGESNDYWLWEDTSTIACPDDGFHVCFKRAQSEEWKARRRFNPRPYREKFCGYCKIYHPVPMPGKENDFWLWEDKKYITDGYHKCIKAIADKTWDKENHKKFNYTRTQPRDCSHCNEYHFLPQPWENNEFFIWVEDPEWPLGGYHRNACRRRSRESWARETYSSQEANSKRRNHPPPDYSLEEFKEWAFSNPIFETLYDNWVKSGYQTDLRPSPDRLDNDEPYTFENLRLVTWRENRLSR